MVFVGQNEMSFIFLNSLESMAVPVADRMVGESRPSIWKETAPMIESYIKQIDFFGADMVHTHGRSPILELKNL